jgi:hypothetical protein
MSKMQPFWWFLPPPYVWPCWSNPCEDLVGWYVSPHMNVQLDTTAKKQGSASVMVTKPHLPGVGDESCNLPLTECADYFGFWARADLTGDWSEILMGLQKPNGAYAEIQFIYDPNAGKRRYRLIVNDPAVGWSAGGFVDYTNLDWLWVEWYIIAGQVDAYVNGVHYLGWYGWNVYPVTQMAVGGMFVGALAYGWLDWLRFYPSWEYPPTYPY